MENRVAQLDEVFRQAGGAADLLAIDVYPAEAMWHVAIDETTILLAELDEARGVLVLSCEVGRPRERDRHQVQSLALRYNFLWSETSGARLALDGAGESNADGDGGSLWLLMDVAVSPLDGEGLGAVLLRFGEIARAWKTIIATDHEAAASAGQSLPGDAVRV